MSGKSERLETVLLVAILLVVGGLAGAASFTHVHDWTMDNSPAGTGDWFGWANAAISELMPFAALLTIRRRRRTGGPIGYPMFLLVASVALSLAAQLAVAKPGPSGWLLSSVPALAFLGLSKLVLTVPAAGSSSSAPVPTEQGPSPVVPDPSPVVPGPSSAGSDSSPAVPDGNDGSGAAVPVQVKTGDDQDGPDRRDDHRDGQDGDQAATVDLVQLARQAAAAHRAATGRPITRDELRTALRVANGTASELLRQIREPDRPVLIPVPAAAFTNHNGTRNGTSGGDQ